jgi:hypothetical protein
MPRGGPPGRYDPIMCSANQAASAKDPATSGLGEIVRAIDQLAADSRAAAPGPSESPGAITPELAGRIAAVWAMLAALDPALARLITWYEARDR